MSRKGCLCYDLSMAKTNGHYSGWVKRSTVTTRFTAPIGETTTRTGHRIVEFAKPPRVNSRGLDKALETTGRSVKPSEPRT